jgi:hypothetical protein
MNTLPIIILVLIAIAGFVVYRILSVQKAGRESLQRRYKRIQSLYDKIENEQPVTPEDVYPFAKDRLTRVATFTLLKDHELQDLFPPEFLSIEKAGESYLANWLEFPTELDGCPDEVEHIKRVTFDFDEQCNFVHYEVYKYRINEPHWAANNGWMLGVVGPYFDDSQPYDHPQATFSRTDHTIDKVSPDEEAKWVHENITNKKF